MDENNVEKQVFVPYNSRKISLVLTKVLTLPFEKLVSCLDSLENAQVDLKTSSTAFRLK